jgi:hypothetical protein
LSSSAFAAAEVTKPMPGQNELQNEFSWSKSRDGAFNACLRGYYYHYYGSWNGWRHDAPPDVRELYVMKNLQSISTWRGSVVHQAAREVAESLREGRPLSVEQALLSVRERMRRDFDDSRTGRYRNRPNRLCGLEEHYYGQVIEGDTLRETMFAAEGSIKRLYSTSSYLTMLQLGSLGILEVEKLQSTTLSGCKVWVSPDVILRGADGRWMIVDWKTSTSAAGEATKLQLAIYGIYAAHAYHVGADQLVGIEENLRLGEQHVFPLNEWVLAEAHRYVEGSVRKMQGLLHDAERNIALFRDFPMTENLALCLDCRFRRACERG